MCERKAKDPLISGFGQQQVTINEQPYPVSIQIIYLYYYLTSVNEMQI